MALRTPVLEDRTWGTPAPAVLQPWPSGFLKFRTAVFRKPELWGEEIRPRCGPSSAPALVRPAVQAHSQPLCWMCTQRELSLNLGSALGRSNVQEF